MKYYNSYIIKTISFTILILTLLINCKKDNIETKTPQCVLDKIKDTTTSVIKPCADAKVDEYKFQSKTVYVFDSETCLNDGAAQVIDINCNSLGYLGGISGNTTINNESFSKATFVKNIWKK